MKYSQRKDNYVGFSDLRLLRIFEVSVTSIAAMSLLLRFGFNSNGKLKVYASYLLFLKEVINWTNAICELE